MKNKNWFAALFLIVPPGLLAQIASAQPNLPARDIGREVLGVFAAKCADCHGADLPKPKGRFGYILDLKRLAGDTEKVIPPHPEESELWALVSHDEMPPPDSPRGPLTPTEKEIVRAWIVAGAPEALSAAAGPPLYVRSESASQVPAETSAPSPVDFNDFNRFARWLGKFHLLLLHFPIALVIAAGFREALSVVRRISIPSESVRYCLWLAALAAIPTAGFGWLFAASGNGLGSPQILAFHRWLGTAAAVWLVVTAFCAERDVRRGQSSLLMRLFLLVGLAVTALTAHLGGLLAQGADFFNY
jgi:uncharacterized membrane protein